MAVKSEAFTLPAWRRKMERVHFTGAAVKTEATGYTSDSEESIPLALPEWRCIVEPTRVTGVTLTSFFFCDKLLTVRWRKYLDRARNVVDMCFLEA